MSQTKRPPKAKLTEAIIESGGNLSRTAALIGCARASLYTWVYQYDLADFVGVRPREEAPMPAAEKKSGPDERVSATVKLDAAVWRAVRIRAIEEDRTTGEIMEEAARAYLAQHDQGKGR